MGTTWAPLRACVLNKTALREPGYGNGTLLSTAGNTYLGRDYSMFCLLGASKSPDSVVEDLPDPFFTGGNPASL